MYQKCGWKNDGYDDDKITWKKDGYNDKDYDDDKDGYNKKDGYSPSDYKNGYNYGYDDDKDDDYSVKNDGYDKYWNEYKNNNYEDYNYKDKNNYGDDNYGDDNYKDKYDGINDYADDKCTADERQACCTAYDKKNPQVQWEVCKMLGCNIKKVSIKSFWHNLCTSFSNDS